MYKKNKSSRKCKSGPFGKQHVTRVCNRLQRLNTTSRATKRNTSVKKLNKRTSKEPPAQQQEEELLREQQRLEEIKYRNEQIEFLKKLQQEQLAREQQEQLAREQQAREQQQQLAREQQQQLAREQLAREQLAREQLAREQLAREQLAREQLAREQLAREQLAREQLAREQQQQQQPSLNPDELEKLKFICSDANVCIAFGKEVPAIKAYFDNFTNFKYLDSRYFLPTKSNRNGFVYNLKYERDNYIANCALKSATNENADNLVYEYLVGKNINDLFLKRLPCFIETYGCYLYNSDKAWAKMKQDNFDKPLKPILQPLDDSKIDEMYTQSCKNSKYLSILLQYVKNAVTLADMLDVSNLETATIFAQNDLLSCLYQIYYCLANISNDFTHYDLHDQNVLLCIPVSGKCINFKYHLSNGVTVSFKSKYIVKIVDYGMSFIKIPGDSESLSKQFYDKVCSLGEICPKTCGDNVGYSWLNNSKTNTENYGNNFIDSTIRNKSHDLRLLNLLKNKPKQLLPQEFVEQVLNKVQYINRSGTPESLVSGLPYDIHNVADAEYALRKLLLSDLQIQRNNKRYQKYGMLGDLDIYGIQGPDALYTPATQNSRREQTLEEIEQNRNNRINADNKAELEKNNQEAQNKQQENNKFTEAANNLNTEQRKKYADNDNDFAKNVAQEESKNYPGSDKKKYPNLRNPKSFFKPQPRQPRQPSYNDPKLNEWQQEQQKQQEQRKQEQLELDLADSLGITGYELSWSKNEKCKKITRRVHKLGLKYHPDKTVRYSPTTKERYKDMWKNINNMKDNLVEHLKCNN